jgi:hypothetical protein
MIFPNDLNVFHDDNGTFVDCSQELVDYGRDTKVIRLITAEDYLYIGLYKPFGEIYTELKVANTNINTFSTAQYYNGTTWASLENFYDKTKGFTRSGFISWTKSSSWAAAAINSTTLFWIRLKPSADHSATTELQGLNIVFADDQDLINEFSTISVYLTNLSLISYITYHQGVRDDIIQALRNSGEWKSNTSGDFNDISKWDILDISQIKKAATYYCLSKIFFELSAGPEDKWYQRSKDYKDKGNKAVEVYYLSLDKNDDGIESISEKVNDNNVSLFRI